VAAGRIVIPPYMPVRDGDGYPVSGAELYVYVNETTTLATVYADFALTIPSANPLSANTSGVFPAVFAEAGTEEDPILYSLAVTDSAGRAPGRPSVFDNYRPSVDYNTATVFLVEQAASAAANSASTAADTLSDIEQILVTQPDSVAIAGRALIDGSNIISPATFRTNIGAAAASTTRLGVPGGRTYYVRTDGSDANTGLVNNAGGAFRTIQRAINAAYSIDAMGSVMQIQVADGTYTGPVNIYGELVGAFDNGDQPLRIYGNETTPANVVINTTNQDAVRIGDKATVLLAGFSIGTTGSGNALFATNFAQIQHRNCRFIACAGEMIATTGKAFVQAIGPTTVAGNAVSFVHATNNSTVSFSSQTITFSGSPVFATYVYGINTSVVDLSSSTIVGKALGGITVHVNSVLNVSSCVGVWTGSQAMFVSNGGLIIAEDKVAARQFYVRADALSQNNSGFDNTPDGAFPSIQSAINRLAQMPYDLVGSEAAVDATYDWRINVGAGTFIGDSVALLDTRFSRVTIEGASSSTTIARDYTSRAKRTVWTIKNQRVGSAGVAALSAQDGAQITFSGLDFTSGAFFGVADNGSLLTSSGPFTISGSASAIAFLTRSNSVTSIANSAVTITGTPALGTFATVQTSGVFNATGATFSGSATGTRYAATSNGVVETNGAGATFLPGSVAGTTATGGQYV